MWMYRPHRTYGINTYGIDIAIPSVVGAPIRFLEAIPQIPSVATNVSKITIPKKVSACISNTV